MYEPIIDPMIFYWMDILSNIQRLPILLLLPMVLCLGITALSHNEYKEDQNFVHKWGKIVSTSMIVLWLISIPVSFFIPTRDTMYKMLIAKQVTPHTLQVTGETAEVIVDKISDKLINVIQEVKK